jgi:hypothetical protein
MRWISVGQKFVNLNNIAYVHLIRQQGDLLKVSVFFVGSNLSEPLNFSGDEATEFARQFDAARSAS